ncbi:MAG: hypothetical protein BWX99_02223 [Deltaproteobacteria bacterium ADurb.Bin151]|nr:MAG: hypothetical protein BWX99_02223 [Deltaproteobacteria bacterium ADurb.Bin151]
MVDGRDGVLPDQLFFRNLRSEIPRPRSHVTVGQLEPCPGKGVCEFFRVGKITPRNRLIDRVEAQGKVRRGHHRATLFGRVVRVHHHVFFFNIFGQPLICTGRALDQFPIIFEEHLQIAHVPCRRIRFPGAFEAAGDGIASFAAFETAFPAKALFFDGGGFRFGPHMGCRPCAVAFTKSMASGNQRDRFFVIHGHTRKGFANVTAGGDRVGITVRTLGIHVNQSHLHGRQGIFKIALACVAALGFVACSQPFLFAAPVDIFFRFPDVHASAGKAEGFKSHRFQGAVAGQNHQIRPGDFLAVFLFDGPKKPTRLVEVHVVGPAVKWCQSLRTGSRAAASVAQPVGSGAVPRHPDEEPTVVAPVGRPPVLRVGHKRVEVFLEG